LPFSAAVCADGATSCLLQEQQGLQKLGLEAGTQHVLLIALKSPLCWCHCRCYVQEQQSWQELGLDADMQRNAAANSYSMMRARIQQLPQATFITEVGGAHVSYEPRNVQLCDLPAGQLLAGARAV
jgi:hypothetical protein